MSEVVLRLHPRVEKLLEGVLFALEALLAVSAGGHRRPSRRRDKKPTNSQNKMVPAAPVMAGDADPFATTVSVKELEAATGDKRPQQPAKNHHRRRRGGRRGASGKVQPGGVRAFSPRHQRKSRVGEPKTVEDLPAGPDPTAPVPDPTSDGQS